MKLHDRKARHASFRSMFRVSQPAPIASIFTKFPANRGGRRTQPRAARDTMTCLIPFRILPKYPIELSAPRRPNFTSGQFFVLLLESMAFVCRICENALDNRLVTAREMMFGTCEEFDYIECGQCGTVQICGVPELSQHYPKGYLAFDPTIDIAATAERRIFAKSVGEYLLKAAAASANLSRTENRGSKTTFLRRCVIIRWVSISTRESWISAAAPESCFSLFTISASRN